MGLFSMRGRSGRVSLAVLCATLLTAAMLFLASFFFDLDPDGELLRNWLYESRWVWFVWRVSLYICIASIWYLKVRPVLALRYSEARKRLLRTESLVVSFILFMEWVAWNSVV